MLDGRNFGALAGLATLVCVMAAPASGIAPHTAERTQRGSSGESSSVFARAMEAYRAGRNRAAIRLFRQAVAREPDNANARFFLGLSYQRGKMDGRAVASFNKALELKPDFADVELPLALALYRLKRYRAAEFRLKRVLKRDRTNASANFFTGLIRRIRKDQPGAIRHFSRATTDAVLAPMAHFNLGTSQYDLGRLDSARRSFETTLLLAPTGEVAAGARQYLESIAAKVRDERRWNLEVEIGRSRSDNVSRTELDQVTGVTDSAMDFGLSADYRLFRIAGATITLGYGFSHSLHDEITTQDFQSHTGSLSIVRPFSGWEAGLDYSFNLNLLDSKKFLRIHTLGPRVSFFPQQTLYTQLLYNLQRKDFFDDRDRDATVHQAGANQFLFFANSKGYLLFGLRYENENARARQHDLWSVSLNPTLQLPLGWSLTRAGWAEGAALLPPESRLRFGYSFRRKDYTGETSSIEEERLDRIKTYSAALSARIVAGLSAEISFSHTGTRSNLESVDSVENVWDFSLKYRF